MTDDHPKKIMTCELRIAHWSKVDSVFFNKKWSYPVLSKMVVDGEKISSCLSGRVLPRGGGSGDAGAGGVGGEGAAGGGGEEGGGAAGHGRQRRAQEGQEGNHHSLLREIGRLEEAVSVVKPGRNRNMRKCHVATLHKILW